MHFPCVAWLASEVVLYLLSSVPNKHQLQLQLNVGTVECETCVLSHSVGELNEGDVDDIKPDRCESPVFPLIKCETEVSHVFVYCRVIIGLDSAVTVCHILFCRLIWTS
jgi:hypothetical protein